jgi:hypothetical protein
MKFRYKAVKKFGPYDGKAWTTYTEWTKLSHLTELISLDGILCPSVIDFDYEKDTDYLVWETDGPDGYNSLPYLKEKIAVVNPSRYRVLAVVKEPVDECEKSQLPNFNFVGYDLVETQGYISALTNCGGFDETFLPADLNKYGLIQTYQKAYITKAELLKNNLDEEHAEFYVWAIWTMKPD